MPDTGEVLVSQEDELRDGVTVEYTPPLTVLSEKLIMHEPIERTSNMIVKNLHNGSVRDRGTCKYRVELLGKKEIQTPAGTFDAYIVQMDRHINLKLAEATVHSRTAYSPGWGWVGEEIRCVTKPMRLFEIQESEQSRLIHREVAPTP